MDSLFLKKQLLREIEEASRFTELNIEFMEENAYLGRWLIDYCTKNHIKPPNLDKLQELIKRSQEIMLKMNQPYRSDESLQPSESDGDLTASYL